MKRFLSFMLVLLLIGVQTVRAEDEYHFTIHFRVSDGSHDYINGIENDLIEGSIGINDITFDVYDASKFMKTFIKGESIEEIQAYTMNQKVGDLIKLDSVVDELLKSKITSRSGNEDGVVKFSFSNKYKALLIVQKISEGVEYHAMPMLMVLPVMNLDQDSILTNIHLYPKYIRSIYPIDPKPEIPVSVHPPTGVGPGYETKIGIGLMFIGMVLMIVNEKKREKLENEENK